MTNANLPTVISSFLGTAAALALGLGALRLLSGWLIEHRLGVALQENQQRFEEKLTRFEVELSRASDILSRRNEREFAVVERAWELMIRVFGIAQANFLHAIDDDLNNYDEEDAATIIDSVPGFSPEERQRLKEYPRHQRQLFFEMAVHAHRTSETESAWGEFKNSLTSKQIFMTTDMYAQFLAIAHEISDNTLSFARAKCETGSLPPGADEIMKHSLNIVIDEKIDRLGTSIRKRFGFEDAPRQTNVV